MVLMVVWLICSIQFLHQIVNKPGKLILLLEEIIIFLHCHHMSLMDFVVSPPGCSRRVTGFWGWDAHEARLRCPDEVDGDIWIWSIVRLKHGGTSLREKAGFKGKQANGVGTQLMKRDRRVTACTMLLLRYVHFACYSLTKLTPPADSNGLVLFSERRNLVSARVPSRFKRTLPGGALNLNSTEYPDHGHHADPPLSGKKPHGRAGNQTCDLMVSSQKRWPLDHETGVF
jgi:hypothetical protein